MTFLDAACFLFAGPVPIRVWIVGHSIVHWAGARAWDTGLAGHLGLSPNLRVTWLGKRGMLWDELVPLVRNRVFWVGPPDILVIQLGENDLPRTGCRVMRFLIRRDLKILGASLPDTVLIWSHLLQRAAWRGARSLAAVDKARRRINGVAVITVRALGGTDIPHPGITFLAVSYTHLRAHET